MCATAADAIADCVLTAFDALPAKCKPRRLADGRREWVPLAGIVLERALPAGSNDQDHASGPSEPLSSPRLICVALATGMKCLSHEKLGRAQGNVLHDCHAEILALRGFNRWIVDECMRMQDGQRDGAASSWLRRRGRCADDGEPRSSYRPPFVLREGVHVHMYCSEAPCGDASMEVVAQQMDDSTAWGVPDQDTASGPPSQPLLPTESPISGTQATTLSTTASVTLHGRAYFSLLGIVRRKPGRADAPLSLSKSCSDKLAMKQCTGLLAALPSLLVDPSANTYLTTVVIPDRALIPRAVDRAFSATGRMKMALSIREDDTTSVFRFRPFEVVGTSRRFDWEREEGAVPSNICAVAIDTDRPSSLPPRQEILINGVLQGRKIFDQRGASCLSRRVMWRDVLDVTEAEGSSDMLALSLRRQEDHSYRNIKTCDLLLEREEMKRRTRELALKGWQRNTGDEEWIL